MKSNYEDIGIIQLLLGMVFILYLRQFDFMCFHGSPSNIFTYHNQLQSFACSWFRLLFINFVIMLVILKGKK
jgi:hypothetical protein